MDGDQKFTKSQNTQVENILGQFGNLAYEWRVFVYMFGKRQERVDILNDAAPTVASMLANVLFDSVLVRLRRLTDYGKRGANENLSLESLFRFSDDPDIKKAYEKVMDLRKPIMKYTSKRVVHSDKATLLGDDGPRITRAQVTDLILAIEDFLRAFHLSELNADLNPYPVMKPRDEGHFLRLLYLGVQKEKELKDQLVNRFIEIDATVWDHRESLPSLDDEYPEYLAREHDDELYKYR